MNPSDQEDGNALRQQVEAANRGGVHPPLPVSIQPVISLCDYFLFRTPNGEVHLGGWHSQDSEGRVSTELVAYNPVVRQARTGSGRLYSLVGVGGRDADAQWVATIWCRRNGLKYSERMILSADQAAAFLASLGDGSEPETAKDGPTRSDQKSVSEAARQEGDGL